MAKLICHASALRGEDFQYKSLLGPSQMCDLCNEFETEDARHFITKCSYFMCERDTMLREINQIEGWLWFRRVRKQQ